MRVVFTCGGTAGHVNPAVAVASMVKNRVAGAEILFVGAQGGMEERLVPREGFELRVIKAQNLRHSMSPKAFVHNAKTVSLMFGALGEAKRILKEFKPDVVVGTGGYACFPAVRAASKMGIPCCIHESNAIPGVTTKLLAKQVDKVLLGFEGSKEFYPNPEKVVFTGMPVRKAFMLADRNTARAELGLDGRRVLLSFFGSLGARDMNAKMIRLIKSVKESGEYQIIHVTGKRDFARVTSSLREQGICPDTCENLRLMEYAYDMPKLMAAADLVVCRAGASTLSEVAVMGKPAILVPSPNVVNDHQEKNARMLAKGGGAVVCTEESLGEDALGGEVTAIFNAPGRLEEMSVKLLENAVFDACDRIYDIVVELAGGKKTS